jgi:uncharacterized protein
MPADKPSKNEDEYFAKHDQEELRKMRERGAAERLAAERHSHHMRCPKCGGHLHTEAFHGVDVDRCPDCHGIWLDHGEIAHLTREENENVLRKVLHDLWASLQKLRAGG